MATRNLDSLFQSELEQSVFRPFYTVEMLFDEGAVRFWTGLGDLVLDGITYSGVGNLLEISSVEETADLSARGVSLTLSGISSSLVSLALSSTYQNRACNLSFGAFTSQGAVLKEDGDFLLLENGDNILREPIIGASNVVFEGYMDQMNIYEDGETATIELLVENRLIDLERPRRRRYSQEWQNSVYPNDKGFDYIASLQGKDIPWGREVD